MTPKEICKKAVDLGWRLELLRDGRIAAYSIPRGKDMPPELDAAIEANKDSIQSLLLGDPCAGLGEGCLPWLYLARQVIAGEFDGLDRKTLHRLMVGFEDIGNPLCHEAIKRLKKAATKP